VIEVWRVAVFPAVEESAIPAKKAPGAAGDLLPNVTVGRFASKWHQANLSTAPKCWATTRDLYSQNAVGSALECPTILPYKKKRTGAADQRCNEGGPVSSPVLEGLAHARGRVSEDVASNSARATRHPFPPCPQGQAPESRIGN
jgi:hypothetical protein